MAKGKRNRRWYLLFRFEDGQKVYLYEPLQKHDLKSKLRAGWKKVS